jgi:hypothetical protein
MQILEGDQSHYQAQKVGGFVPPDVRDVSFLYLCALIRRIMNKIFALCVFTVVWLRL